MRDQERSTSTAPGEISALKVHDAVMREGIDPDEAYDPGPYWFYIFLIVAIFVAGFYLGRHYGKFGTEAHIGYLATPSANSAQAATGTDIKPTVSGSALFNSKCAGCHQTTGMGLPGAFPPLVKSPFVLGDPEITLRIVLHGLTGPLTVEGQSFNGIMPAWASQLNDAEIAAVVTYIRNGLGSNAATPVKESEVTRVRQATAQRTTPWTAQELANGATK